MSRLLRSLKFTEMSGCWRNNLTVGLRAITLAAMFVLWGTAQSVAQTEFPCELTIVCPDEVTLECGDNVEDLDLTGSPTVSEVNCFSDLNVTHSDAILDGSTGCNTTIARTWTVSVIGGPSQMCTQMIHVLDTEGPVFVDVPANASYQCEGDVPSQPVLDATDCNSVTEVVLFDTQSGFDTLLCTLTTPVGPGPDWALWLNGLTGLGLASNDYYTWVAGSASMSYFIDGTALLTGDVVNMTNPSETWNVQFFMENGKNWADWSAMGRSYKDDLGFGAATHTAWTYYELVPIFSKLIGTGANTGNSLFLSHQPSNYYFGFQFGQGANNRNNHDGGSGWFYYTGVVNGQNVSNHGDLTTDESCVPVEHPDSQCNMSYTRYWRASDACGNFGFAEQEITIHDTTGPVFENCPADVTIECNIDALPAPVPAESLIAIDNCAGVVEVAYLGDSTFMDSQCLTRVRRDYAAFDSCGNRTFCSYTVFIEDHTSPELTVPASGTFECDQDIIWGEATAYDMCQGPIVVAVTTEFFEDDCYGYWVRNFTADDGCGNISTGSQTINIIDTTAPVFEDYEVNIYVECDMVESVMVPAATDNCDDNVEVVHEDVLNSGGCLGVIMRTFTATDNCGNSVDGVQYIHIQDTTPPTIDEPADFEAECDNVPAAPGAEGAYVYDNCGNAVTVEFHTEMMDGPCADSYTILWIWEAWDYCELYSTDTTVVTIHDTTDPELTLPQGNTFSCEMDIVYGEASATDNCDDDVTITFSDVTTPGACPQAYSVTRTWVATDNCGNTATGSVTYYVVDETDPTFTDVPGPIEIECDEVVPSSSATAEDNCGLVTVTSTDAFEVETPCYSLIIRTFTATDECGNTATTTQSITILDTTAPVITYLPEIELPCDNYNGIYATATDNCDDSVEVIWILDEMVSGGCTGRIIRTYGAYDQCDNYTEVQQMITLTDDINPIVVEQTPDQVIECGSPMPIVDVVFDDNCDDELEVVSTSNSETIDCITYVTYTFTATDNCNNSTTAEVVITIEDTQDPYFIDLPGDMVINCDEDVPAIVIPPAYDVCDDNVTVNVVDDITPGSCPQSYVITRIYRAYDDCGNEAVESRTITVQDIYAPVFDEQPSQYAYECDDDIALIQPTATDNCSQLITYDHTDFWEIESDCNGFLIRTWSATDECLNTNYFTQYISIYDETAPVITGEFEIDMPCDDIDGGILVTATDNCDQNVEIVIWNDELASGGCAGRIIRTYRAYDNCENWSEFTQFITLIDETAPVASVDPADAMYECDEMWSATEVTFTDNCDEELVLTPTASSSTDGCTSVYVFTWTATDECGNTTTVDQTITVTDTTAPVVEEPTDFTLECGQTWDIIVPSFSDNCDEELTYDSGVTDVMVDCDRVITYWWSATDNCGNMTYIDQVLTIEDTTAPLLAVPQGGQFNCDEDIVYGEASASDVCDETVTLTFSDVTTPGSCPQSYTVVRTWVATDDCGNSTSDFATYTVVDLVAPMFTFVPANETIECDEQIPASDATAEDNCDTDVTVTQSDSYVWATECYTEILRTFVATDDCGNADTAYQTIYIYDTTAPVITGEFEIEMPCDDISTGIFVTATDNCDDDVFIEIINDELASGGCAGRIIRTYRAWDNCQNWVDFTQFITLTDNTPPSYSFEPMDMEFECGADWAVEAPVFSDNCDQELTLFPDVFVTTTDCQTIYHYTWIATDACDNTTTVDQLITVTDTTAPVIDDQDSESTVECNVIVDFVLPDASDLCDDAVEVVPAFTSVPGACPGEYTETIVFTAYDNCGNSSSVTHIVHHTDTTAPILENIPVGDEYSCDEVVPTDLPTAFDYCSNATVSSSEEIIPGQCPNSYEIVRTFWATDECGNMSEPVEVSYWIYDNTLPTFDNDVTDESYQCAPDWATYVPQTVTATDNCGEATVTVSVNPFEVDNCNNGWWIVTYTATDLCFNSDDMSYWIHVEDTEEPVLSEMPASVQLDCGSDIPSAPVITALDNCNGLVTVSYDSTCIGDCPVDGQTSCDLITPVRPASNVCNYPVDWAMALFAMPNAYKWYQLVPGSGTLTENVDGSITVSGTLVNAFNANAGFTFNVTFGSAMDWAAWSSQAFPTGFKDDCGGVGANHESWMYYILQAGPGAELVGWGDYAGSALDLTHAPANHYFGFQYGDGANNYNAANGLGGWFGYHGTFLVNGQPVMSGFAAGAGDFAFEVDCCPNYQIVRCWSAMDCSGNEVSYCQTITFGDLGVVNPPIVTQNVTIDADKGEIAIVSIMPNPANEKSQISFMSKETGRLSLQVMDMTGRIVADLFNNTVEGGIVYKADFAADQLPAGMYMVRLNSSTESDITRMQIAR